MYIYTLVCVYVCVYMYICIYMYIVVYILVYMCIYTCIYTGIYTHIYLYVYYIYLYIFIYTLVYLLCLEQTNFFFFQCNLDLFLLNWDSSFMRESQLKPPHVVFFLPALKRTLANKTFTLAYLVWAFERMVIERESLNAFWKNTF